MKKIWMPGTLALAGIAALSPSAVAARSALPPLVIPRCMGVNIHFTRPRPGEMRMLAHAGFHWVRMDFFWANTEKTRGRYNFSAYDRLLAALKPWHIHALLILDYANPLYDHGLAPYDHAGRAAFARWATAAARHFKGRRVLWEMYNEPNGNWFWKLPPGEKAADRITNYIKLALATGRAIHRADPHAAFIGPAESGMNLSYVKRCFQGGLLKYWCAVSMHPYRQTGPETVAADYEKLKKLIAHYEPRGRHIPIIAGEWGYSSAWKNITPKVQGQYLAREFLINISNGIPLTIWYDWHDDGTVATNSEHNFGTVLYPYNKGAARHGWDLSALEPLVAKPHSPDNKDTARNCRDVKVDRAYVGSCTGGKITDMIFAASILKGQRVRVKTYVVPGSTEVHADMKRLNLRGVAKDNNEKSIEDILLDAGCEVSSSGCSACLGGPPDTFGRLNGTEVCISTTNRNFPGRMGSTQSAVYLASPLTVAASALTGHITDPREYVTTAIETGMAGVM